MGTKIDLPKGVEQEHLNFLDDLRDSGVTNMFGAGPYVEEMFEVDRHEARKIVKCWMETFEQRHAS